MGYAEFTSFSHKHFGLFGCIITAVLLWRTHIPTRVFMCITASQCHYTGVYLLKIKKWLKTLTIEGVKSYFASIESIYLGNTTKMLIFSVCISLRRR